MSEQVAPPMSQIDDTHDVTSQAADLPRSRLAAEGIVFVQVKGHPFWPAQIIPNDQHAEVRASVRAGKNCDVFVQFFGTLENAWVGNAAIVDWSAGVQKKYLQRKLKVFHEAARQVVSLVAEGFNPTAYPPGWWCYQEPEVISALPSSPALMEDVAEETLDSSGPEMALENTSLHEGGSKTATTSGTVKASRSGARTPARRLGGAQPSKSKGTAAPRMRCSASTLAVRGKICKSASHLAKQGIVSRAKLAPRPPNVANAAAGMTGVAVPKRPRKFDPRRSHAAKRVVDSATGLAKPRPGWIKEQDRHEGSALERSKSQGATEQDTPKKMRVPLMKMPKFKYIPRSVYVSLSRPRPVPIEEATMCSCPSFLPSARLWNMNSLLAKSHHAEARHLRSTPANSESTDAAASEATAARAAKPPRHHRPAAPVGSPPRLAPLSQTSTEDIVCEVRVLPSGNVSAVLRTVTAAGCDARPMLRAEPCGGAVEAAGEGVSAPALGEGLARCARAGDAAASTATVTEASPWEGPCPLPGPHTQGAQGIHKGAEELDDAASAGVAHVTPPSPATARRRPESSVASPGRPSLLDADGARDENRNHPVMGAASVGAGGCADGGDDARGKAACTDGVGVEQAAAEEEGEGRDPAAETCSAPPSAANRAKTVPVLERVKVLLEVQDDAVTAKLTVKRRLSRRVGDVPAKGIDNIMRRNWTGCGEECIHRTLKMFCDARVCPAGPTCSNRPFHLLKGPKVEPVPTPGRGWGGRAGERIAAGQFVIEYVGELIDDRECERRLWEAKRIQESNFYLMEIGTNLVIDARHRANYSRFLNSSCGPNCETQKWRDPATNETRVGIFALRDIEKGEELTYDYKFNHFGGEDTTSFECLCGAPECRGTLDARPERHRDHGRKVAVQWDDNAYYSGVVTKFNTKQRTHTIIYDDGDVELIDLSSVKHRWLSEPTVLVTDKSANKAIKRMNQAAAAAGGAGSTSNSERRGGGLGAASKSAATRKAHDAARGGAPAGKKLKATNSKGVSRVRPKTSKSLVQRSASSAPRRVDKRHSGTKIAMRLDDKSAETVPHVNEAQPGTSTTKRKRSQKPHARPACAIHEDEKHGVKDDHDPHKKIKALCSPPGSNLQNEQCNEGAAREQLGELKSDENVRCGLVEEDTLPTVRSIPGNLETLHGTEDGAAHTVSEETKTNILPDLIPNGGDMNGKVSAHLSHHIPTLNGNRLSIEEDMMKT